MKKYFFTVKELIRPKVNLTDSFKYERWFFLNDLVESTTVSCVTPERLITPDDRLDEIYRGKQPRVEVRGLRTREVFTGDTLQWEKLRNNRLSFGCTPISVRSEHSNIALTIIRQGSRLLPPILVEIPSFIRPSGVRDLCE